MQKSKLFNILNTILLSIMLLVCGISFVFQKNDNVDEVKADYAVIDGVDNNLVKLNRFYSGIVSGEFQYSNPTPTEDEWATRQNIVGKYEEPQFTMLYNDLAKQNAEVGSIGTAENVYFSFGKPQSEIIASSETVLNFLINLNVTIYFNDTPIYVNNNYEDSETIPGGNGNNTYFSQFIDLTNVYNRTDTGEKGSRIENASGLYTIEVDYQVMRVHRTYIENNWSYSTATETLDRTTMKYAFYLLDESEYINYPSFDTSTVDMGNYASDGTIQYFYNFNKKDYPTYSYDASKYNIEFTKVRNKDSATYSSTFTLNPDLNSGTLTFVNTLDSNDTFTKQIEKVGNTYPVTLNFTEQGVYTITNRYIVNVSNKFVICNNIVAESNLYEETENEVTMVRSMYKLHIFGFTANYNNSGKQSELLMLNEGALSNKGNVLSSEMLLINEDVSRTIYSDVSYLFDSSYLNSYDGSNKLYDQIKAMGGELENFAVVSTDQPPISFSYFGEYSYNGIKSLSSKYKYSNINSTNSTFDYLRKDAYVEDAGYYEIIINYTYSEYSVGNNTGNSVVHTQAFIFVINNTSPQIKIEEVTEEQNAVSENGYTNKDVRFIVNPNSTTSLNDNYFNAPINVVVTKTNFAGTSTISSNYTQGTILSESAKYFVTVSYGLNAVSKDTYSFIIDKDPISKVKPQAVDSVYETNSDNILYYQFVTNANLNEYYNNSTLFNQPFALLFDRKASGAEITVTYKRIYFTKNLTAGTVVLGDGSTYVTTNYELDLTSTPQTSEYYYDFDMFESNRAHVDSVFDLDTSCLILFYLKDEAGNEFRYYIIYDLTRPYVNVTPEIENSYNIVSNDATVSWGDYKAIKIIGNLENTIPNSTEKYSDYISSDDALFNSIFNSGTEDLETYNYLTIPINQIYINYIDSNNNVIKNYYVKNYDPYDSSKYQLHLIDSIAGSNDYNVYDFVSSISLFTGENGEVTNFQNGIYVGENNISYNVSDKSNISNSNSSIKNDTSYSSNIWLNLDKSLGLAFIRVSESTTSYGQLLNEKTPIAGNQLRFSYLPGADNYEVGSVTYDYYEIDASSYTEYVEISYEENEPTPYFPYKVTPTLSNQTFNIDSITKSDDPERVFSEIINQDTVNGQTVTKNGMYVFKRTYVGSVEEDKVRYYVFYVDRTGIIEIDAELLGDDRIVYEQGYGFVLNFSKDGTKFTALQVQQYLASVISPEVSLFTSNKLPITFEMPFDKYNTRRLLTNENTANAYKLSEYYNLVRSYNESLFKIDTEIVVETILENNITTKTIYTALDFLVSDIYTANCIKPGTYTITINDNSGYLYTNANDEQIKNYNCNTFSFRFDITHNAPEANYHTKDLNLAVSNKESSLNGINYQEYVSTNSRILQLSFDKNTDPYKATINTQNFSVYRDNTRIFYLNNNRAYLNNALIYTITNDVPMINGNLETRFSSVLNANGQKFEVKLIDNVITGLLNDVIVYEYKEGLYRAPNNDIETKYSSVFGSTLSKFVIENDIATYTTYQDSTDSIGTSVTVFTLTDDIPINPQGEIATEYSRIFVYDESLNKYVITLYNADDTEHTYITNYLTEATYKVELMFEGESNDYSYSYEENGNTINVNYFSKQFAITVDRTAPSYNLNQLKNLDKFYTNKSEIDTTKYFFAVDSNFVFVKQNELETNEIFYKFLGDAGPIKTQYEYSITPDNPAYNTGELSSHDRFIETAKDDNGYIYNVMYYGRITESLGARYGYYEIIERDEAGNYTVYAIYYNNPSTEIKFTYEQAESNGIIDDADETLTETTNPYSIKGRIVDADDAPIAGITVKVQNSTTITPVTTNDQGEFVLSDLVGIQTIEFVSDAYSFIPATKRVNELNYAYDEATMDQETLENHFINVIAYEKIKGTLSTSTPTLVAEGQNLSFDFSDLSSDYYLKAIITGSNGLKQTIINEPDVTNIPDEILEGEEAWTDFLTKINTAIKNFSTENNYGYTFTIEFVNRFNVNYTLTYVLPGIMLTPTIVETVPNSRFTFTIPSDPSGTTYIRRLEVRKFSGGSNGSWTLIARDSNNTTISTYNDDKPLSIATYTFTEGEYMFTLTDNFNRVSVHYKGVGVNDVRTINYGQNTTIGGITYTASAVTLEYQTELYQLKVVEINADGTRTDITNSLRANGVTEVSTINNIRKLEFQNTEIQGEVVNGVTMDGIREFEVSLHVQKLDLTYTYKFVINRTNPNIELRNLGGEKLKETSNIAGNPTIHTEDFTINWNSNNALLFNPQVKLTRTYYEDNVLKTEVINSIANGYRISNVGTYKAEIYNSLGFSDPNKTIYFRRIEGNIVMYSVVKVDNGYESELQVSSDMPNIYIGSSTGEAEPLYKYYALKYQSTVNEVTTTTYDTVEIRVNPSKGLTYKKITEDDQVYDSNGTLITANDNVYRIFGSEDEDGTVSYGYNRYIQIVYILSSSDFVKANIETADHVYSNTSTTLGNGLRDNIKNIADSISISFPGFNGEIGNPIQLSYSFNGIYVETIYNFFGQENNLTLSNAGVYTLTFFDLAGNVQKYNMVNGTQTDSFTISLINNVLFTINGETPIQNEIFNSSVILEITNLNLYDLRTVDVTAKKDGKEYTLVNSDSYNTYLFEEQGYYTVTMTANVTSDISDIQQSTIVTVYNFAIINVNQALRSFNIPLNPDFTITKVLRENVNITYKLENNKELWISCGDENTGSGVYTITISAYVSATKSYREFTFKVWINDEVPVILCSIDFGKSTTKQIQISFNRNLIYQQIGDSIIRITGMDDIIINEETSVENIRESANLVDNRVYTIQVLTADGKVISSYKVTKKEPLNTISIIIIVISSLVAIGLIITFVVLRKHIKYR